jgi:VWFA-related protein
MMVDTSGSQRYVLEEERRASLLFLQSVMREDKDVAFVIHFDGEVELLQDLTSSRKKLEAALSGPELDEPRLARRRGGLGGGGRGRGGPPSAIGTPGTALYDAILLASDELMRKQSGRKALILLTDGVDEGSRVTLNRAIEAAQRADTLLYSILFTGEDFGRIRFGQGPFGQPGPPVILPSARRTIGGKALQRLARETGGGYFEVTPKMPLAKIFERIEEELRSQYSLGYTPEGGKQGYRKIKVIVGQKGLTVQAREGYYSD